MNKKFQKILTIGIDEFLLDSTYWQKIKTFAEKIINFPKDSLEIKNELADADCLLTGFGIVVNKKIIDNAPNLKYIGVLATAYDKI
ncbi:MAG: hypothetical protein AAB732_02235 [Patescibacteria group bacterium]